MMVVLVEKVSSGGDIVGMIFSIMHENVSKCNTFFKRKAGMRSRGSVV